MPELRTLRQHPAPRLPVPLGLADHVLIGEEMFVARAYMEQDPSTTASVLTQDILRWLVIVAIAVLVILNIFGFVR